MAPIDTSPFTPIPPSAATRVNKLSLTKKRRLVVEPSGVVDDPLRGGGGSGVGAKRSRLEEEEDDDSGGCCHDGTRGMSSYHNHHHHHHPLGYMGGLGNGVAMISGSKAVDVLANGGSSSKYSSSSSSSSAATTANSASSKSPSIASLCNLGNTCFLNSVLYTLRFTPGFLHNLHHMVHDLTQHNGGGGGSATHGKKQRNGHTNGFSNGHADSDSSTSAVATASSSSKSTADSEMVQEVIEQLHDLFKSLSCADDNGDSREPIPPSNFLNAVGKLNPMFEGNQQQDAHELLVMILNTLQDIKIPAAAPPPESAALSKEGNGDAAYISSASVVDKKGKLKKGGGSKLQQNGSSTFIQNGLNKDSHAGRSSPSSTPPLLPHRHPQIPVMLPNFVRENFEGKAVMSTRCLECEMSTFRSEAFIFIDVPLHLDDDDVDELSGKDLFLKQIMMSETLRENNKYWCEECSRLNEAQRSVHYELLPRVMVLQLKRFTATGSKYMSKINDYIPTPFTMNCFCHQCIPASSSSSHPSSQRLPHQQQQPEPKHHYRLYAVIMHLGATLASGHYIAYVRASPDAVWDQSQCQRVSTVERNKNKKGILKFLRRNNEPKNGDSSPGGGGGAGTNGGEVGGSSTSSCRSSSCCGIRGGFINTCLDGISIGSSSISSSSTSSLIHQRSSDSCSDAEATAGGGGESNVPDDLWLECDDESIQVITRKQFEEILGAKQGATTPYLLFYQRV